MENLTQRVEFQSKFGATIGDIAIKAFSTIPGIIFILLFIVGILKSSEPSTNYGLIIAMNIMFAVMLLIKKVRRESFIAKGNKLLSFAYFFEGIWAFCLIYNFA